MRMQSLLTSAGVAAASVVLAATPAFAGNAHFIASHTSVSSSGTSLVVNFKEAGLESGSVETITVSAHLDATYQCINGGHKNPDATNKTSVSADVSQSGEFTASKNGNVVGSLTLSAPADAADFSCPPGQRETLTVVAWSNISIEDEDSGAYLALPGTFSFGQLVD